MYEEANSKAGVIEVTGRVVEVLSNSMYSVELENGNMINCHISGKMRMNYIKVSPDDIVTVELSPFDLTRGRIIYRN